MGAWRRRSMIEITNPRRGGGLGAFVRALVVVALWLPLPAALVGAFQAADYAQRVPQTPDILRPLKGHASELRATDGTRLGGLLRGRRPWVPSEQIPAKVKFAFLAAEDDAFYDHQGFDPVAIARAFLRNRAAGRIVEGGSTITQQVAKRYLGAERRYERKIIELLLARRLEATFGKDAILESYLNEVYLGAGAYGVRAAAEIYFDRNLEELTWDQAALIASVTSSPSSFNPFRKPALVKERRGLVLGRLARLGVLEEDEAARLSETPLGLRDDWDGDEATAPYAAVEVREQLKREFGDDVMQHGSYEVTLALSPHLQNSARASMAEGLRRLDRRQGYRGPVGQLPPERHGELARISAEVYGVDPQGDFEPVHARPYLGVVVEATPERLGVEVLGRRIEVGAEGARWASPYSRASRDNEVELADLTEQFAPGDLILVAHDTFEVWDAPPGARRGKEPRRVTAWRVDQPPKVEGAMVSAEIDTGYVRAIVGGWDFDRSGYNRAVVGCRQPGSVFKPIVYSAAIDKGLTPASLLADAPVKVEKSGGEVWTPKNADNDFSGFLILRDALARSRNLPAFEVFSRVGPKGAARRAYDLGITTEMAETEALSLGSSCVTPWDMTRVYGTFARQGIRMEPRLVLTIRDTEGQILRDHGHFADPAAGTAGRLDRLARAGLERPPRVLDDSTAYIMVSLLRAVVYAGTAYAATSLGVPAAGKTGTTNAFDAWFVGFTEDVVTSVWIGADNNDRALGKRETGGRVALPVWVRYMRDALRDRPQGALSGPPPDSIEIVRIDRESGKRAKPGEPGLDLPFKVGTAPEDEAPDRVERAARKTDRIASEF